MKRCPYLFPLQSESRGVSAGLLVMRVAFGLLLASHGFAKLSGFSEMSTQFPGLFGLSPSASLALAIFGELVCSIAVIGGFLTRLAVIPPVITMLTAFIAVHKGVVADGELALLYLLAFVVIGLTGAGKYSIDYLLAKKCFKN